MGPMTLASCRAAAAVALVFALLPEREAEYQRKTDRFVAVGVSYAAPATATDPARARERWRRDLSTIKSLGFNSVWTSVDRSGAGQEGGALEVLGSIAEEAGLYAVAEGTGVEATSVHADAALSDGGSSPAGPAGRMARLDAARSAGRNRGWVADVPAGRGHKAGADSDGAELRLWGWAAISRGARAVRFSAWYPAASGQGMTGPDGTVTERARAAGEFAGVIARNGSLFAPLRPRASRVAIVSTLLADRDSSAIYRALFERNIQADFLNPVQLLAGDGSAYRVLCVGDASKIGGVGPAALERFTRNGGTVIDGAPADLLNRLAAAGVAPDIRIDGAPGLIEARFLESPGAILLIAINHADTPQTGTLSFAPDIPEAIWQNMESGAAVSFVQGPDGPVYIRTFGARDVMVLVRAKRLR